MARTFGIAADLVRAFDVVTGDGNCAASPRAAPRPVLRAARRQGCGRDRHRGRVRPAPVATFYGGPCISTARTSRRSSTGGEPGRDLPEAARRLSSSSAARAPGMPPHWPAGPPWRPVPVGRRRCGRCRAARAIRAAAPSSARRRGGQALHRDRLGARRPGRSDAGEGRRWCSRSSRTRRSTIARPGRGGCGVAADHGGDPPTRRRLRAARRASSAFVHRAASVQYCSPSASPSIRASFRMRTTWSARLTPGTPVGSAELPPAARSGKRRTGLRPAYPRAAGRCRPPLRPGRRDRHRPRLRGGGVGRLTVEHGARTGTASGGRRLTRWE